MLLAEGHLFDLTEPQKTSCRNGSDGPRFCCGRMGSTAQACFGRQQGCFAEGDPRRAADRDAGPRLATDCDREGQPPHRRSWSTITTRGVVMRVMFNAQDPQTICEAFTQAKPNIEYARLYAAAVARRQADQIYNPSPTRTATVTLAPGARTVIGVGRVKTPTLGIVCKRELEIRNFALAGLISRVVATAQAEAGPFRIRHRPQGAYPRARGRCGDHRTG